MDADSPMLGGRRRYATPGLLKRPRTVGVLLIVGLATLVLLPENNRSRAHSVLTNAGVPLPDALPDRLQDFFDSWNARFDDGSRDLEYVPPPELDKLRLDSDKIQTPHIFHPNGHLIVEPVASFASPPAPHPILTLIKRAEADWNHKVARQSKTVKQAAAEYRRRYSRNPPKGFDKWFNYAQTNQVVLTDEYDQIHRDLEVFWALEPTDLRHRMTVMEEREETFTIQVREGKVNLLGEQASLRRAKDLGDLISRFSAHIPEVNLTFTKHDQPACQLGWFHKERMVELAKMGEHYGPSDYVAGRESSLSNWADGCPPDSPLRELETAAQLKTPGVDFVDAKNRPPYQTEISAKRSYIYDHQAAMDICMHPEIMPVHGFTVAPGTTPGPLVPLFTFAKTNIHSDVLVTPLEQYAPSYIGFDLDWGNKPNNKLMWRGSTTGANFFVGNDWKASQRSRLHFLTHEKKGAREVLMAEGEGPVKEEELAMSAMNSAYMDVSFSGSPLQCDAETCAIMENLIDFQPTMGLDESYLYKYVMDVDGNGWSGRFHRLMSMKAAVLKSSLFPEWYTDRVQPWVHYIPVKVDYTDLYDILTFFRGDPSGKGGHDDLGEKIGMAGKIWARDHWRHQDMASYMFRLCLEWARLLNRDSGEPQDYWDLE